MPDIKITRAGVKTVARFIAARSVSTTISLICHQNAHPGTKLQLASVHVGAFVLGEMVGNLTQSTVDDTVDQVADVFDSAKKAAETRK